MLRSIVQRILLPSLGASDYDGYKPKPFHLYKYAFPLLLVGTALVSMDYFWFGFFVFISGVGLVIFIPLCIFWDKATEYWTAVDNALVTISKIKDLELRANVREKLGFSSTPDKITIVEQEDNGQGFTTTKIHEIPSELATMHQLQAISDIVLTGGSFSETELVTKRGVISGPKFRKLQDYFEHKDRKWIKSNHSRYKNQGFSPTRKGKEIFYKYASESVKQQLSKER